MTQKQPTKPSSDPSAKVVVFGVDNECKPHAAWFSKTEAEPAKAAAKQLRLNVIQVTNGTAADLVAKLPPGRIHAAGPGMVPTVREDLYEKLVGTINPKGEAGKEPGEPTATDLPTTWDAIKPGHVVLIHDSLVEGWWAGIVTARAGDKLSVRWRDYPGYAQESVPVTAVALLHPKGS
jgi:hypothetical protein